MGNKKDRRNAESSLKDPIASDHTLLGSIPKFDKEIIKDLPAIASDPDNVSKPLRSAARTHIMSKQIVPLSIGSQHTGESNQQLQASKPVLSKLGDSFYVN